MKIIGMIFFIAALPILFLGTALARVFEEMKGIPFYVWRDLRMEWSVFKHVWKRTFKQ